MRLFKQFFSKSRRSRRSGDAARKRLKVIVTQQQPLNAQAQPSGQSQSGDYRPVVNLLANAETPATPKIPSDKKALLKGDGSLYRRQRPARVLSKAS